MAVATQDPDNINLAGNTGDFVAVSNMSLNGAVGGTVVAKLGGFNAPVGGNVTSGNASTGAAPANTTIRLINQSDCPAGAVATNRNLFTDNFSTGVNDSRWPASVGYDGDFNGDWYTDGTTARYYNPNWGGASPGAPIPTTTGFVKFLTLCPAANANATIKTTVTTTFTDLASDTTLVLYFFDRGGNVIGVSTNAPLKGKSNRGFALFDATIPSNARNLAVVPMAYISRTEQGSVFFGGLSVDYEPAAAFTKTSIVAEDYSRYGPSQYGDNHPIGWDEFGGAWFVIPQNRWVTLWNPKWGGDQSRLPPVDTGLLKSFSLVGKYVPGDTISARAFAATTFTDPNSFVRVRLVFNSANGPFLESDRLGYGWGNLDIRRQPIPAGAVSVFAILNAYLGPNETSSLYSTSLTVDTVHANPGY